MKTATAMSITLAFIAALTASTVRAQVDVVFIPASGADRYDAGTYQDIWETFGERIVSALEARTCMPFSEPVVRARVAEAVSNSGGPNHPMRLRSSYAREVKASTLVHELGHRHLWQLGERLENVDSHMTLYLVLDSVWADVWGDSFAARRIAGESGWDADYAHAWAWAQSLGPDRRSALWNRLLKINGYSGYCYGPLAGGASAKRSPADTASTHGLASCAIIGRCPRTPASDKNRRLASLRFGGP